MKLKKAFIIGIGGSLWLKIIEWVLQNKYFTEITIPFQYFVLQLIWMLFLSGVITYLVYVSFENKISIVFVPFLWYALKEIYNYISVQHLYGLFDAVFIGIPIGFAMYYFVEYKKVCCL